MAQTRLEQIIDAHRAAAERDDRSLDDLVERAALQTAPRDFTAVLKAPGLSVIAEIKRRSPSAGDLNPELDPATVARDYAAGGAACLSVLTDEDFFGGSVADLQAARDAVEIPVLRKDFTVDARDVVDARIMGADAILLIVAALSDAELQSFFTLATHFGIAALFEVHDAEEIDRAVAVNAQIIGVNQRNLHTFEIDLSLAEKLHTHLPPHVVKVAESGLRDAADARRAASAGYDAVLVGSSLVTAAGRRDAVAAMAAAGGAS